MGCICQLLSILATYTTERVEHLAELGTEQCASGPGSAEESDLDRQKNGVILVKLPHILVQLVQDSLVFAWYSLKRLSSSAMETIVVAYFDQCGGDARTLLGQEGVILRRVADDTANAARARGADGLAVLVLDNEHATVVVLASRSVPRYKHPHSPDGQTASKVAAVRVATRHFRHGAGLVSSQDNLGSLARLKGENLPDAEQGGLPPRHLAHLPPA